MTQKREIARRIFAREYLNSTVEIKGDDTYSPTYILTPVGAMVNRLYIVGTITDVTELSGGVVKARISDPTGTYQLYSGQFQIDATQSLLEISYPSVAAVIGKVRTYKPEDDIMMLSVRPEVVSEVDDKIRDYWILDAAKYLMMRLEVMKEALQLSDSNTVENLTKAAECSEEVAKGIVRACRAYEVIDLNMYYELIRNTLELLVSREYDVEKLISRENMNNACEEILKMLNEKEMEYDEIRDVLEGIGYTMDTIEDAISSLTERAKIMFLNGKYRKIE